jgi:hypothetical protein
MAASTQSRERPFRVPADYIFPVSVIRIGVIRVKVTDNLQRSPGIGYFVAATIETGPASPMHSAPNVAPQAVRA